LQASRCGYPRSVTFSTSRDEHLYNPLVEVSSCLGVDDPSTPAGSIGPAVDRSCLSCSHRCRSQCPDGFYDREFVARCAANRIRLGCRHLRSRPFARSGRRTIDGAIRCRQLQPITIRRTTGPTPLQRRGCELSLVLLGPRRAFTVPCRSLTLSCRPVGTPESVS
jgi:hypothetical protein